MIRYTGPYVSKEDVERQSRATMKALCRRRGKSYPIPAPRLLGGRPLASPEQAQTTHATPWHEERGNFWLRLTEEIEGLEDTEEEIDGRQIRIQRVSQREAKAGVIPRG